MKIPRPDPGKLTSALRNLLATVPTTNFRIVVHIGLSVIYVTGTMIVALWAESKLPPFEYHASIGTYLLIAMGIDTVQFSTKRKTWRPDSPQEVQGDG